MYDIEKSQKKAHLPEERKKKNSIGIFFSSSSSENIGKGDSDRITLSFSPDPFFSSSSRKTTTSNDKKKIQLGKGCVRYGRVSCPIFSLKSLFFFFPFQREPGRRQTNRLYRQSILFLSFRDLPITTEITKQKTIPGSCFFLNHFPIRKQMRGNNGIVSTIFMKSYRTVSLSQVSKDEKTMGEGEFHWTCPFPG